MPDARARSFGMTFGVLTLTLAAWLFWKNEPIAPVAVAGGIGLLLTALLRPAVLRIPCDLWWRLAKALGWMNSRIVLLAVFFLVLTPVGLVRRLFGVDILRLRRREGWTPYPIRYRERKHYERLF